MTRRFKIAPACLTSQKRRVNTSASQSNEKKELKAKVPLAHTFAFLEYFLHSKHISPTVASTKRGPLLQEASSQRRRLQNAVRTRRDFLPITGK